MEIYLLCFFKALAIRKVMGWGEEAKALKKKSSKSFEKYTKFALPSAQKNPISGEDGESHLKKVRVITQQNQEVDSVNQTWR